MNCRDRSFWQTYLDNELLEGEGVEASEHLASCRKCEALLDGLRVETNLAAAAVAWPANSEGESSIRSVDTSGATDDAMVAWGSFQGRAAGKGIADVRKRDYARRFRPALAAVAVVAIMASVTLDPVRTVAANVLQIFRLDKFETIAVGPMPTEEMMSIASLGDFSVEPPDTLGQVNLEVRETKAEAERILGGKAAVPATVPYGYESLTATLVSKTVAKVTFDLEKIEKYAAETGLKDLNLPKEVDGATLVATIPGYLQVEYGEPLPKDADPSDVMRKEDSPLIYFQAGLPSLTTTSDVDVEALRREILRLPVIPQQLRDQLNSMSDWKSTLPIPIDRTQVRDEKVVVDAKYDGLYLTGTATNEKALVWSTGKNIFAVVAPHTSKLTRADLFAVAAGVPIEE